MMFVDEWDFGWNTLEKEIEKWLRVFRSLNLCPN